jgi:glyoxylase-like metal-dependent hydrolase (beta-lactamase superfamily II)
VEIEAILITHCHFDHIGAVAPVASATGAPVYCPEIEVGVLADIMKWTMPGFGPFDSWQAEHTVKGGERLRLADLDVEVVFTPGHSPGHLTYAISSAATGSDRALAAPAQRDVTEPVFVDASEPAPMDASDHALVDTAAPHPTDGVGGVPVLFSGDVLFQGSVGRVDLPGGDWGTLERSIGSLMGRYERNTVVYPGHMGVTTLGREWDTNPFLSELRASAKVSVSSAQAVAGRAFQL